MSVARNTVSGTGFWPQVDDVDLYRVEASFMESSVKESKISVRNATYNGHWLLVCLLLHSSAAVFDLMTKHCVSL